MKAKQAQQQQFTVTEFKTFFITPRGRINSSKAVGLWCRPQTPLCYSANIINLHTQSINTSSEIMRTVTINHQPSSPIPPPPPPPPPLPPPPLPIGHSSSRFLSSGKLCHDLLRSHSSHLRVSVSFPLLHLRFHRNTTKRRSCPIFNHHLANQPYLAVCRKW